MGAMWRGWQNAEIYDRFVREHRVYRRLNQRLVDLARLQDARRVLDLGCGTGATTLTCLRVLDMDAEVVGVDASEEMVEVARANILDLRARFDVATAASADRVVQGPFDRAVCNAAFWQFPAAGPVFESLATLLASGARFVFNVPAERIRGESAPVHPFQVALARSIEERAGRPFPQTFTEIDPARMDGLAAEHGFHPEERERFVYEGKQGELMDLMAIPAMIVPMAPSLSDGEREAALREARNRTDPDEPVDVPWVFFTYVRR
jgi:SAM-dependent methyltransferase